MTQSTTMSGTGQSRYDGTDYVCKTCGSEIMVKHRGDESKGYGRGDYVCTCGTAMQLEHPEQPTASSG
jgi:DNA-directed RNA polymerase subunit RPC12/RpoP